MKIAAKPSPSECPPVNEGSNPHSSKKMKMDPVIRVQLPNTTNIGKGATSLSALIMQCARHSDGTSRKNACSQLYRCDKGTIHIAGELPHVDIFTQRAVYMASHKSRHEGFTDTDAWKN